MMRDTRALLFTSLLLLGAGYFAMWYFGLFEGLGWHGTVAAVLGIVLTSVVGVGLMTLVFHSHRMRYDEDAHDAGMRPHRDPRDRRGR